MPTNNKVFITIIIVIILFKLKIVDYIQGS